MKTKYSYYAVKIKQNPGIYGGGYYANVIGVESHGSVGGSSDIFTEGKILFEIPLNGPGRSKALKKVKGEITRKGLELTLVDEVLKNTSRLSIKYKQFSRS